MVNISVCCFVAPFSKMCIENPALDFPIIFMGNFQVYFLLAIKQLIECYKKLCTKVWNIVTEMQCH